MGCMYGTCCSSRFSGDESRGAARVLSISRKRLLEGMEGIRTAQALLKDSWLEGINRIAFYSWMHPQCQQALRLVMLVMFRGPPYCL
jgi:hypothetical protein